MYCGIMIVTSVTEKVAHGPVFCSTIQFGIWNKEFTGPEEEFRSVEKDA